MSMKIDGVPETITRADYVRLIESVGLDPNRLISLEFKAEGVQAVVDSGSKPTATSTGNGEFDFHTHSIWIKIDDEAPA